MSYYSKVSYTGDGSTATFGVPFSYIDKAHVSATVNGSAATIASWPSSSQVTLSPAPANGSTVWIARTTPRNALLVTWPTPVDIKASKLNLAATQALYIVQEALDSVADSLSLTWAGVWDARNKRITNVANATNGADAVPLGQADGRYMNRVALGSKWDAQSAPIGNLPFPLAGTDAASKSYVDSGDAATLAAAAALASGGVGADVQNLLYNVKAFGALGDGNPATNDTAAVIAASNAASAAGKGLYWPSGTYMIDGDIVANTANWRGDGENATIIRIRPSASPVYGIQIGNNGDVSTSFFNSVRDMQIDGNGKCSGALLRVRNCAYSSFSGLVLKGAASHAMLTESSHAFSSSLLQGNTYHDIKAYAPGGNGFKFIGEHLAKFSDLIVINAGATSYRWECYSGTGYGGAPAIAGNEECTASNLISMTPAVDSFQFDNVDKFVFGSLFSMGSGRYGMRFSFEVNPTTPNQNNVSIASYVSRNDVQGAIVTDAATGGMSGVQFGSVDVIGFGSTGPNGAVILKGASNVSFGSLTITAWPGTALFLGDGTPRGGSTVPCTNIQFGNLTLSNNGNVSNASRGLQIQSGSTQIQIGNLRSANSFTTGSYYEIVNGSSVGSLMISNAIVVPAAAGHEVDPGTTGGANVYGIKNF